MNINGDESLKLGALNFAQVTRSLVDQQIQPMTKIQRILCRFVGTSRNGHLSEMETFPK